MAGKTIETTPYGWPVTIFFDANVSEVWLYHATSAGSQTGQAFYSAKSGVGVGTINSASGQRDYWTIFYKTTANMLFCCPDFQETENGPNDNTGLSVTVNSGSGSVAFSFANGDDAFTLNCVPYTTLD